MKAFGGDALDPLWRSQRFYFEPEVTIDFLFLGALLFHLPYAVTVTQQLEVLPRREQENTNKQHAQHGETPQLALTRPVYFAYDRIVTDVLSDCVLKIHLSDQSFGGSQFRTARTRVSCKLGIAGPHRPLGQDTQDRRGTALKRAKCVLDNAVLQ